MRRKPGTLGVADIDGDAVTDLVTANWFSSTVSVLRGRSVAGVGDGTFEAAVDVWSGAGSTAVGVGQFDADGRPDVVVGRVRDDQLALLVNNSPHGGDGVIEHRDIPYIPVADDSDALFHTLDVYEPAGGTSSFLGAGEA